jgi:lipopolysaccharide exporter
LPKADVAMMKIINNLKLFTNNMQRLLGNRQSLLSRAIHSGGLLSIGSILDATFRFIRNIILARLLAPDAFGLIWTIAAILFIADAVSEVGLSTSVIQNKKGADKEFLNVIWWMSACRGITLYLIAYFASPLICSFLNIASDFVTMLRAAFTVFLFRGLTSPRIILLQKELKFKKWVFLSLGATFSATLTAIIFGFILRSAWALVLGVITEAFMIFLLSYIFFAFIPKFEFNRLYASEIIKYSRKFFGLPILTVLYAQADNFVIAKVLSLGALGMYGLVKDVADMPNKIFSKINPLFLPTFALMQDDKQKLKKTLLTLTEMFASFALPLFTFTIIFAKQILSLIYTEKYSAVAIPYAAFSISVFIYICSLLITNVFFAIGQPHKQRIASMARVFFYLIALYPATKYYGLLGVAVTTLLAIILSLAIQTNYLKKLININLSEYLTCFIKGMKYSLIVLIPGCIFNAFLPTQVIMSVIFGGFLCLVTLGLIIKKTTLVKQFFSSSIS